MSVQQEFLDFNDRIKLDYNVAPELAEKRNILLQILRNSNRLPGFNEYDQGSYGMHLGVRPLNGKEYDIDVGLRFNANIDDYDPKDIKNTIADILKDHTDYGATIKNPCVTVTYKKGGEAAYHIDLVTYFYEDHSDKNSQLYLDRGKGSNSDDYYWEKSDPVGLVDYVNSKIEQDDDRKQFRRIVRYIKRWKNMRFNSSGHSEPSSIGITLIVVDNFTPDSGNDMGALLSSVKNIQNLFQPITYDSENRRMLYRIKYSLPTSLNVENNTDTFEKMTNIQMTDFKDRIDKLINDLESAQKEPDEIEQCKKLQKILGDDFHVPEAKNISKAQHNYIPPSSASGGI